MNERNYTRYFRVFENDTTVTEISTNDFKPLKLKPLKKDWLTGNTTNVYAAIAAVKYGLQVNNPVFYGHINKARAMEIAKAGAIKYINLLISEGEAGAKKLLQYRVDHYDDLHFNLVEANIQQVEDDCAGAQQNED